MARYRTAIVWGTVVTLGGSLCLLALAGKLTALFSKGIVSATPTPEFTLAVLVGASAWVGLATATTPVVAGLIAIAVFLLAR